MQKYDLQILFAFMSFWHVSVRDQIAIFASKPQQQQKKNLAKFQCIIYPEIQFLDVTSRFDLQKICSTFPNIEDSTEVHKP